ncbi:arylsulfatase G-like [Clytia hemisphaerica]|uniref:Sulfatase N-terminal domain-containing protein n=1 Tax=Clytia hemisphaerica TaxID=252671 RepID=A0A7M5XFF8_9CNID
MKRTIWFTIWLITNLATVSMGMELTERPNLLIFLVDDLGYGDVGFNKEGDSDGSGESPTPNMDALSKEGIRFTDYHSPYAVCTPSRASLLTSRLGARTGLYSLLNAKSIGGLPTTEYTLSEHLKKIDYSTFAIGKWHLGLQDNYHPNDRGFDHYLGVPYSLDMGCLDYPGYSHPKHLSCKRDITDDVAIPLYRNKTIIQQPLDLRSLSDIYFQEFQQRMEEIHQKKTNFFGYIPFSKVHVPLGFAEHSPNNTAFSDNLKELDVNFGRMIQTVKDLGLFGNTVIWLISDNGPWELECQFSGQPGKFQGLWQKKKTGGGGGTSWKETIWEGGHRVPAVVTWPQYIKEGRVSDALISGLDIMPTMASLMGFELPTDRHYDGEDLSRVLKDGSDEGRLTLFHPRSNARDNEITAVRWKNYKAVFKSGGLRLLDCHFGSSMARTYNPPLLFDLKDDPSEAKPLDTTDPFNKALVGHLKDLLEKLNEDIADDFKSKFDDRKDSSVMPCCNAQNRHCRCQPLIGSD